MLAFSDCCSSKRLLYARIDDGVLWFVRLCPSAGLLARLHHLGVVCNVQSDDMVEFQKIRGRMQNCVKNFSSAKDIAFP